MTSTTTTATKSQLSTSTPKSNLLQDSTESSPIIQRMNENEIESLLKRHLLLEEENDEGKKIWNAIHRYCAYRLDSSEFEILSELSHYLLVRCCSLKFVDFLNCFSHSLTRSLPPSLPHSLTHSFIHLFIHSFIQTLVHSQLLSFICFFVIS
jgi:hypothetical protein